LILVAYNDNRIPTKTENKPKGKKSCEKYIYNFKKTKKYNFTKITKKDNLGTIAKKAVTIIGEPS